MICDANERTKRQPRQPRHAEPAASDPEPRPRIMTVFRRADDTVCHARCGRPLSLQGVRGLLEADFYCLSCLMHVSLPVAGLDTLPMASEPTGEPLVAAL